jgi:hypothetical protein
VTGRQVAATIINFGVFSLFAIHIQVLLLNKFNTRAFSYNIYFLKVFLEYFLGSRIKD